MSRTPAERVRLRRELFYPTPEGEARLLLLIHAFSDRSEGLEGRLKLAKLDFLLRYPAFFERALSIRAPTARLKKYEDESENIETRMIRYRYGPWDPAYFSLIGRLVSRGLVQPVRNPHGVGLRTTEMGAQAAVALARDPAWESAAYRASILSSKFDLTGTKLKEWIYKYFPEVSNTRMGEQV